MPRKKIQEAIEKATANVRKWTYHVVESKEEYIGKVKDESGRVVFQIIENLDYNQLTRLIKTSKYMKNKQDMRGLAAYLWDRGMVPMEEEERQEWLDKKVVPLEIQEVR